MSEPDRDLTFHLLLFAAFLVVCFYACVSVSQP